MANIERNGGAKVEAGFYWNKKEWEMVTLSGKGGVLPGDGTQHYVKVPLLAMLFMAPLMGGLYVMFLPFVGFALLFDYAARRVYRAVKGGAKDAAVAVAPAYRAGEAHLAGEPPKDEKKAVEESPKADERK
ncbi:hypothetical protein FBQ97_14520 [Acidobacteria bacterium ACD]|nr:MAG: hypothetical protein EDX89_03130 [Acidobacteriota bacterium]MCE7959178.1 hypothetical protein [Acidobacteria bacterium ACB2]MDL1951010.1 hypothetical protein [Acidobacteria bacterium ACD]